MTEGEWLACKDPERMLDHLGGQADGRKLRLFACACCRRVWHFLTIEHARAAVAVAERYADGGAGGGSLRAAFALAAEAAADHGDSSADDAAVCAAADDIGQHAYPSTVCAGRAAAVAAGAEEAEHTAQAALLRDIFKPFRPVPLDPACRTPTALSLAQAAYDERSLPSGELDLARLAVLADALEEAGCTNEDILAHLRTPGPHVRGCWAMDLILGKE